MKIFLYPGAAVLAVLLFVFNLIGITYSKKVLKEPMFVIFMSAIIGMLITFITAILLFKLLFPWNLAAFLVYFGLFSLGRRMVGIV